MPEIMRCSLTSSMLQLKCLNLDLETLDFMDKPDIDASALPVILRSRECLYSYVVKSLCGVQNFVHAWRVGLKQTTHSYWETNEQLSS